MFCYLKKKKKKSICFSCHALILIIILYLSYLNHLSLLLNYPYSETSKRVKYVADGYGGKLPVEKQKEELQVR